MIALWLAFYAKSREFGAVPHVAFWMAVKCVYATWRYDIN